MCGWARERTNRCAAGHVSVPIVVENLAYLEKRVAQMQYLAFQAERWPIGSSRFDL
jgi:hypothetical protein